MNLLRLSVGQLDTNCYLVWDHKSKSALIIDPADCPEYLAQTVLDHELNLKYILATHGHFDHNLASAGLKAIFNVSFMISRKDIFLLKSINRSARFWLKKHQDVPVPVPDRYLESPEPIILGSEKIKILPTPGHTPGSVSFLTTSGQLFCGDTLFADGVGRTDFKYSSANDLRTSLSLILRLPAQTEVFPGHGEPFRLEKIDLNSFLKI